MEHRFTAILEKQDFGFHYNNAMLPPAVAAAYAASGVKRVVITVNGSAPLRRALISDGQGGSYLIMSKDLIRAAKAKPGGRIDIVLWPDPNPDQVDVPEEFAELINQDEEVAAKFNAMTPGRQRSLMIYITQAKSTETRIKRALELGRKMVGNNLYDDRKARGEF